MGFSCKFSLKPYLHFHVYRKTPYLMGKSMVSCRFSLKPIHWVVPRVCSTSMSQLSHAVAEAPSQGTIPRRVPRRGLWASKRFQDGWNTKQNLQTLSWLIYFQYFPIFSDYFHTCSIRFPYIFHTFSIRFHILIMAALRFTDGDVLSMSQDQGRDLGWWPPSDGRKLLCLTGLTRRHGHGWVPRVPCLVFFWGHNIYIYLYTIIYLCVYW